MLLAQLKFALTSKSIAEEISSLKNNNNNYKKNNNNNKK